MRGWRRRSRGRNRPSNGAGKLRILRQIEQAGIARATARRATDEVFESIDPEALIEASLAKRLRGRERIGDRAELGRLYRYLIGQGFGPDEVMRALRARSPSE